LYCNVSWFKFALVVKSCVNNTPYCFNFFHGSPYRICAFHFKCLGSPYVRVRPELQIIAGFWHILIFICTTYISKMLKKLKFLFLLLHRIGNYP
jgi:hypothetical protein